MAISKTGGVGPNPTQNVNQEGSDKETPKVVKKLKQEQDDKGVLKALVDGRYYDATSYDSVVFTDPKDPPDKDPHNDKHSDGHSDIEPPNRHIDKPHVDHTDNHSDKEPKEPIDKDPK